jgi:sulfite exporter TauE/SafE
MYLIAISLGFLGSLHCIGMCGPLALGAAGTGRYGIVKSLISGIHYNVGKSLSYGILGFGAGFAGNIILMAGIQKSISIISGALLIAIAIFAIQPDIWIQKFRVFKKWNALLSKHFQYTYKSHFFGKEIYLGFLNGFLPCGLVYIALAGAVTLQHPVGSAGFMVMFGAGTMPALLLVFLTGPGIKYRFRHIFQKIYPIAASITGLYLIYRGIFSELPLQLDFIQALQHPVMCHQ